jgi:arsenate reductase
MDKPVRVLFLCTGNSCRSQIAEGWARTLKEGILEPFSAGLEAQGLNPWAVRVMEEAGVDIAGQQSNTLADLKKIRFDYVITLCGGAREQCPVFPAKTRVLHHGFDDPPALVQGLADKDKILNVYRRVRDEIKAFVETLPESLKKS